MITLVTVKPDTPGTTFVSTSMPLVTPRLVMAWDASDEKLPDCGSARWASRWRRRPRQRPRMTHRRPRAR